jgi:hypothetical protein
MGGLEKRLWWRDEMGADVAKSGDYAGTRSLLSGFSGNNTIENNYYAFYSLVANYLEDQAHGDPFSSADSTGLLDLAERCPEMEGACIFQARALYEFIYPVIPLYPGCNDGTGARPASLNNDVKETQGEQLYRIMPNPASDRLYIFGKGNAHLKVTIYDNIGRNLHSETTKLKESRGELSINLPDGIYHLRLSDETGNVMSTKIVIVK